MAHLSMPCFHPLRAWPAADKPGVVFLPELAKPSALPLDIPCGKCTGCRATQARHWALRIMHEAKLHRKNSFLTLTYNSNSLPRSGSLELKDFQRFARRYRKKLGPLRYFTCGEYTDDLRPHWHVCLFGEDFEKDRIYHTTSKGKKLYRSPTLEQLWSEGFSTIGQLEYTSANYVARYVLKKVQAYHDPELYWRTDPETGETFEVRPEFVTMSRRPGLASDWFNRFKEDVYPSDEVIYEGKRFRPPRYYDSKLTETELEKYKQQRRKNVALSANELSPRRLYAKEKMRKRRNATQKRNLGQ